MANLFTKAPIEIPNKSGFDMSHENFFTATCGTLTPCLVDYLLPNDTVSVGFSAQIQLPPMATDFYGEVVGKYELFFVPNRLLYGGWKDVFIELHNYIDGDVVPTAIPYIYLNENDCIRLMPGSLADYLGFMASPSSADKGQLVGKKLNLFPFLAYHKIYDDWYRDARLTEPCFTPNPAVGSDSSLASFPWDSYSLEHHISLNENIFNNGHALYALWQRNWPKDYFTNATLQPEAGDPASLSFSVNDGEGSFTIAGLRAANSLQMFMERNNIAGNRYQDRIRAHYGIYPSDALTDKCLYLGGGVVNVYTKSIFQNGGSTESENPFDTVGTKYGSSQGVGTCSLCKKFTASEHGVLMCIFSLVPRRYYSSGVRRQLRATSFSDIPFPSLAGVGDQEILMSELVAELGWSTSFGYTQRYAEYKFMNNEVHGLLRDGCSLSPFCLQTSYNEVCTLGSGFIEIPKTYLDQVSAVNGSVSEFGCWNDTFFSYKKVSTLPAYSIPTLENMKHSHIENVPLGGTRL